MVGEGEKSNTMMALLFLLHCTIACAGEGGVETEEDRRKSRRS